MPLLFRDWVLQSNNRYVHRNLNRKDTQSFTLRGYVGLNMPPEYTFGSWPDPLKNLPDRFTTFVHDLSNGTKYLTVGAYSSESPNLHRSFNFSRIFEMRIRMTGLIVHRPANKAIVTKQNITVLSWPIRN